MNEILINNREFLLDDINTFFINNNDDNKTIINYFNNHEHYNYETFKQLISISHDLIYDINNKRLISFLIDENLLDIDSYIIPIVNFNALILEISKIFNKIFTYDYETIKNVINNHKLLNYEIFIKIINDQRLTNILQIPLIDYHYFIKFIIYNINNVSLKFNIIHNITVNNNDRNSHLLSMLINSKIYHDYLWFNDNFINLMKNSKIELIMDFFAFRKIDNSEKLFSFVTDMKILMKIIINRDDLLKYLCFHKYITHEHLNSVIHNCKSILTLEYLQDNNFNFIKCKNISLTMLSCMIKHESKYNYIVKIKKIFIFAIKHNNIEFLNHFMKPMISENIKWNIILNNIYVRTKVYFWLKFYGHSHILNYIMNKRKEQLKIYY